MVKGGEIGGFGGGSLESQQQCLGTQWASLFLGVLRCDQSRQARTEEAQEPSWLGRCQGGAFTMLRHQSLTDCLVRVVDMRPILQNIQPLWLCLIAALGIAARRNCSE